MKQIFTTTLRLNLNDEDDRRAFERLRQLDKRQYRSYSKAIVAAVNGYFERQTRLAADPYLETREKEDAFLKKVLETISAGMRASPAAFLPQAPGNMALSPSKSEDDDLSAALDFADSF